MKTSAANAIFAILGTEVLSDEELARYLPGFSRNTIRRARRDLERAGKVVLVGEKRYKRAEATA